MNNKQKMLITSIILVIIIAVAAITFSNSIPKSNKLNVIATFYPLAFLSQEIGGDQIQVIKLVPSNTEIHGWEPSASDIMSAEDADVIIYNGAGLDHWIEDDILTALSNTKTRIIVETTLNLDLIANEEEEHEEESEEHNHGLYDPHTWVSPYMAKLQAEKIYNALVQADPDHESYYTERWLLLEDKLEHLDTDFSTMLSNAKKEDIFVSHGAFGYLAYRYGFEQHSVIGLSADEQPSAATIANLVDLMKENETYNIFVDPVYSTEYAQTIKSEVQIQTGHSVSVLELYLMLGPVDDKNLLEQMQANLDNLKIGLEAT